MITKKIHLTLIILYLVSPLHLMPSGPSLQFANGTNTGLSSPIADTLAFGANGEDHMNIDSTDVTFSTTLVTRAPLYLTNLFCRQSVQIHIGARPSSDVTVNADTSVLFIDWTGNQNVTVNITLPPNPIDGQLLTIMSNQYRSKGLTLTYIAGIGGATVDPATAITELEPLAAPTGLLGGASVTYIYSAADTIWYRFRRG